MTSLKKVHAVKSDPSLIYSADDSRKPQEDRFNNQNISQQSSFNLTSINSAFRRVDNSNNGNNNSSSSLFSTNSYQPSSSNFPAYSEAPINHSNNNTNNYNDINNYSALNNNETDENMDKYFLNLSLNNPNTIDMSGLVGSILYKPTSTDRLHSQQISTLRQIISDNQVEANQNLSSDIPVSFLGKVMSGTQHNMGISSVLDNTSSSSVNPSSQWSQSLFSQANTDELTFRNQSIYNSTNSQQIQQPQYSQSLFSDPPLAQESYRYTQESYTKEPEFPTASSIDSLHFPSQFDSLINRSHLPIGPVASSLDRTPSGGSLHSSSGGSSTALGRRSGYSGTSSANQASDLNGPQISSFQSAFTHFPGSTHLDGRSLHSSCESLDDVSLDTMTNPLDMEIGSLSSRTKSPGILNQYSSSNQYRKQQQMSKSPIYGSPMQIPLSYGSTPPMRPMHSSHSLFSTHSTGTSPGRLMTPLPPSSFQSQVQGHYHQQQAQQLAQQQQFGQPYQPSAFDPSKYPQQIQIDRSADLQQQYVHLQQSSFQPRASVPSKAFPGIDMPSSSSSRSQTASSLHTSSSGVYNPSNSTAPPQTDSFTQAQNDAFGLSAAAKDFQPTFIPPRPTGASMYTMGGPSMSSHASVGNTTSATGTSRSYTSMEPYADTGMYTRNTYPTGDGGMPLRPKYDAGHSDDNLFATQYQPRSSHVSLMSQSLEPGYLSSSSNGGGIGGGVNATSYPPHYSNTGHNSLSSSTSTLFPQQSRMTPDRQQLSRSLNAASSLTAPFPPHAPLYGPYLNNDYSSRGPYTQHPGAGDLRGTPFRKSHNDAIRQTHHTFTNTPLAPDSLFSTVAGPNSSKQSSNKDNNKLLSQSADPIYPRASTHPIPLPSTTLTSNPNLNPTSKIVPLKESQSYSNRNDLIESPHSKTAYKDFYKIYRIKEKESLHNAYIYATEALIWMPHNTLWKIKLELADICKRQNNYIQARILYEDACILQPLASQTWLEYSKFEEECGYIEQSLSILVKGLKLNYNESILSRIIRQYEKLRDITAARNILSTLKYKSIDSIWKAVFEGALLEVRAGEVKVAREILKYLMEHVTWYVYYMCILHVYSYVYYVYTLIYMCILLCICVYSCVYVYALIYMCILLWICVYSHIYSRYLT